MLEKYLDIREDIKKAIAENKPVVALESTIYPMVCHILKIWSLLEMLKRLS